MRPKPRVAIRYDTTGDLVAVIVTDPTGRHEDVWAYFDHLGEAEEWVAAQAFTVVEEVYS